MSDTIESHTSELARPTSHRHLIFRSLSGVISAAMILAVGELVAVLIAPAASPFLAIGSTAVDRSPAWAREFAIQTFGTNDKPALFGGMVIVVVVVAALAGVLERTRGPVGSILFAILGVAAVGAALARPNATLLYAVPTIVGTVAGIATLRVLTAAARPSGHPGTSPTQAAGSVSRRRFLTLAAGAAAIAATGGATARVLARRLNDAIANRRLFRVPAVGAGDRAAPIAPGTDIGVPGASSFITPTGSFYRIDTALQVPRLTTDEWQLRMHGMVEREIVLDWADLVARTPIERVITLTCVSNEVGGTLAGNASWTGYPIGPILDEIGVDANADMLLSTSSDGFTVGTPLAVLRDGRDAMLAVAMNGEALPFEHGYPVRQVVPGLYGFVSATKWVVDWKITRFDREQAYWTRRGWAERAPIKTASRIEVPASFARVAPGTVLVAGTAWAQHRGIALVEVRVDDGEWQPATLAGLYSIDTWRQWTWMWNAEPGSHTLQVRATDLDGNTQTDERVAPIPDGATGWHSRSVSIT
ncbi:molybdopterin-dependent oxidoreductase [Aldersonia sp. NBC_00410]|uniref:molybdopterin-dependent oxidoreductase n=1 Tax=Aldersonia sp. NBC_00410 TaxID=2975954 RepID=UPI002253A847|nr:molybdopterin-dependent oxidoreductase [Aldersonia sp. NBC_00410]MCX5044334.1 molybdopterin-dependent oxidoreductase [Aldersonia sp. NBC_00410]